MAPLNETDRDRIWRHFMRENEDLSAFRKSDLRAAVDATDSWIEANQAAYNGALPAAFRSAANLDQKTNLFCWVAMRRAGLLPVAEDN